MGFALFKALFHGQIADELAAFGLGVDLDQLRVREYFARSAECAVADRRSAAEANYFYLLEAEYSFIKCGPPYFRKHMFLYYTGYIYERRRRWNAFKLQPSHN